MTPLTIKNPETLIARMDLMETKAIEALSPESPKSTVRAKINKCNVECRATATIKNGAYVLFYVNDKRTSRANLPQSLGI